MSQDLTKVEIPPDAVPPPAAKNAAALVAMGERGIMLRSLEDLLRFARLAVEGGAAPKGMTVGGAALAMQVGLERGLGPLGGLQALTVINGAMAWRGQAAAALIQNSPVCRRGTLKFWTEGEGEDAKGVAVAWRVHYPAFDRREFTVKDAKTARLWGKEGPWRDHPKRQLMWRAVGFLARDVFPDVLGGFPLAEEAQDFEPAAGAAKVPGPRDVPGPPPAPDPIFELFAEAKPAPVGLNEPADPAVVEPPFASHEEADRAIAAAEAEGPQE